LLSPSTKVKGNDIIWTLPLKSLPKEVRAGAKLHDVVAYSDIVEPVLGSDGPSDAGVPTVFDTASSSKTWIIR
jgi:hypothetical protein